VRRQITAACGCGELVLLDGLSDRWFDARGRFLGEVRHGRAPHYCHSARTEIACVVTRVKDDGGRATRCALCLRGLVRDGIECPADESGEDQRQARREARRVA